MRKKFPWPLLFLGILSFGFTIYSIVHFPPSFTFVLWKLSLPLFPFIVVTFILFIFCLVSSAARSITHGLLLAGCTLVYLLLRLFGLTSLFFLILVLALCVTLELFFINKK